MVWFGISPCKAQSCTSTQKRLQLTNHWLIVGFFKWSIERCFLYYDRFLHLPRQQSRLQIMERSKNGEPGAKVSYRLKIIPKNNIIDIISMLSLSLLSWSSGSTTLLSLIVGVRPLFPMWGRWRYCYIIISKQNNNLWLKKRMYAKVQTQLVSTATFSDTVRKSIIFDR